MGSKVKFDELLQKSLGLITDAHIKELQQGSLSSEDRKESLRQIYIKECGSISKDYSTGLMMTPEYFDFLNKHSNNV